MRRRIWGWVQGWFGIGFFGRYRFLAVITYPITLAVLASLTWPALSDTTTWSVLITISGGMTGAVAVLLEVLTRMVMSGKALYDKAVHEGEARANRRWTRSGALLVGEGEQGAVISVAMTTPDSPFDAPLIVLTVNDNAVAMSIEDAEQLADEVPRTMRLKVGDTWWEMPSDAAHRISVALTSTARRARNRGSR